MYMSLTLGALLIAFSTVIIVAIIAFVAGLLIGFLLVTPARIAMDRSSRENRREQENLETELRDLRQKNSQLEAEHAGIVTERDHLRQQLAQMQSAQPVSSARPTQQDQGDGQNNTPRQRDAESQQDEQPSFGDRVRGLFNRPREGEEQPAPEDHVWPDDQPPVPVA